MAVGNLKKQASKKNEGSLAYVKGGLSTFFEAQDALACTYAWFLNAYKHNLVSNFKDCMKYYSCIRLKETEAFLKEKEY